MDLPGNMANMTNMTINVSSSEVAVQPTGTVPSSQNTANNAITESEPNTTSKTQLEECLICSDSKRDTIFKVRV